jgi:hypothetical protein
MIFSEDYQIIFTSLKPKTNSSIINSKKALKRLKVSQPLILMFALSQLVIHIVLIASIRHLTEKPATLSHKNNTEKIMQIRDNQQNLTQSLNLL